MIVSTDSPDNDDFLFDDELLLENDPTCLLWKEDRCDQSDQQDHVNQTHDDFGRFRGSVGSKIEKSVDK